MPKVLITGSNGFLGRYISEEYYRNGWSVYGLDRDLSQIERKNDHCFSERYFIELPNPELDEILQKNLPDLIVHAAGPSSVQDSMKDPGRDFSGSIGVLFPVLNSVREFSPESRLIYLSSAAVYGDPSSCPISENSRLNPVSPYGYHKMLCEKIIKEFFHIYAIGGCSVRIFSAYGPGLKRQVLWDIYKKAVKDQKVSLSGTGDETRDFIHAADIARGIFSIGEKGNFSGEIYNLGSGKETSILELSLLMVKNLKTDVPVQFSGLKRKGDPDRWVADISKLKKLGFSPTISLKDGISSYLKWLKSERL